jgi:3-hydroxyisobutyrate dehydrogenase
MSTSDTPRIAILGTGKMGSAIAGRLEDDGFELILWNRTRARAEALGIGRVADSPRSAAIAADVVISSLTGPEAVRAAYLGPDGALSAGTGKLFIEMSTAGPDLVHELAKDVVAAGARLIDAPIVGAPPFMRAGKATILVGGDEDDVERGARILGGMGTNRQ